MHGTTTATGRHTDRALAGVYLSMLLGLGLNAGCLGNITNEPFSEDALFLAALPSQEQHSISVADQQQAATDTGLAAEDSWGTDFPSGAEPVSSDDLDLLAMTEDVSASINDAIFTMLGYVDLVRASPPTERGDDYRLWGPWSMSDGSGNYIKTRILRSGEGYYEWSFQIASTTGGPWTAFFTGAHLGGETVEQGVGEFLEDITAFALVESTSDRGTVDVQYDNRDGVQLAVQIEDLEVDDLSQVVSALYWYQQDQEGTGEFEFQTWADLDGAGLDENTEVKTRWSSDQAVRSDASLSAGDLGQTEILISQCWNQDHELVYQWDSAGILEFLGDEADCPYVEASLPQHLQD